MVAGDSVMVNAGTYDERVSVTKSGSSGSPINYMANGTVNIKGFNISGCYVKLKGFDCNPTGSCSSTSSTGFYLTGDYCIIEDDYAP